MATNDFWGQLGGGLLGAGAGYMQSKDRERAAADKKSAAEDPLFMQMQGAAGNAMNLAGGIDPKAHAAERFGAQQALVAPGNEAAQLKLQRELQAKGLTGVASNAPVANTVAVPGQPMNPHMAALLAAQEGAKAKASYDSLREGEGYLDNTLKRAGMLSSASQNRRASNMGVQPPKAKGMGSQLLTGLAGSLMKNPGMLGQGFSALGSLFGGGSSSPATTFQFNAGGDDADLGNMSFDMPSFDMPSFDMPSFELPRFDFGLGGVSDGGYDWF